MPSSEISIDEILKFLPHRYPFLLIDRVLEFNKAEKTLTAIKNVTFNEPFFQGHFPGKPVMPGVLIIEAMAQAAGLLALNTDSSDAIGKMVYLVSIDGAKFRKPVVPGDVLKIKTALKKFHGAISSMYCEAYVDDVLAAEATIMAKVIA